MAMRELCLHVPTYACQVCYSQIGRYKDFCSAPLYISLFPLAYFYTTYHSFHSKHNNLYDYVLSNSTLVPEVSNVRPPLSHLVTQYSAHPLRHILQLLTFLQGHVVSDCPPNSAMSHGPTSMTRDSSLVM